MYLRDLSLSCTMRSQCTGSNSYCLTSTEAHISIAHTTLTSAGQQCVAFNRRMKAGNLLSNHI